MIRRKGFTLPEMLTVMAIMLIIITILMPIFARARGTARYVKWKAYSARLRSDIDLVLYYNFEEQVASDLILRNRAVGDPHKVTAKFAVDPERRDGQLDTGASIPEWTRGRWHGKGALDFDGSADVVKMGTALRLPEAQTNRSIYGWGRSDANGGNRWLISYGGTGQEMRVGLNGGNGAAADIVGGAGVFEDLEWHMIALTYDGTTARFYVDGREMDNQAKTWDIAVTDGFVGANAAGSGDRWDGAIDEVAIFGSVLTPQQIAEIHRVGSAKSRD